MKSVRLLLGLALVRVRAITQLERRNQEAKQDLLGMHCIERSACMRLGGNMIGYITPIYHPLLY